MSHLSKIKTRMTDQEILRKTLNDLKLEWEDSVNQSNNSLHTICLNIDDIQNKISTVSLAWDGESYELLADSDTWQHKRLVEATLEKIHQRYAHNTIMYESIKQGFKNTDTNVLQDGSLRIVLERWQG